MPPTATYEGKRGRQSSCPFLGGIRGFTNLMWVSLWVTLQLQENQWIGGKGRPSRWQVTGTPKDSSVFADSAQNRNQAESRNGLWCHLELSPLYSLEIGRLKCCLHWELPAERYLNHTEPWRKPDICDSPSMVHSVWPYAEIYPWAARKKINLKKGLGPL